MTTPHPTGRDYDYWHGTLLVFGPVPSGGGGLARPHGGLRTIAGQPALYAADGEHIGSIHHCWIHADEVRAEGSIRPGLLPPGHRQPVTLDADDWLPPNRALKEWRLVSATLTNRPIDRMHIRLKEPQ